MKHIVIIGNGISGVTAARHIRKLSDKQITIVSAETDYFFSRTALMYVYMGHMTFEHTQPYEIGFGKRIGLILKKGMLSILKLKVKHYTLLKVILYHMINSLLQQEVNQTNLGGRVRI